jgi:O-antigen/teichoic acid export membrane protein
LGVATAFVYRDILPENRLASALTAASISLFFLHAQEFVRRAYFMQQRVDLALRSDVVRCATQLCVLLLLIACAPEYLTGAALLYVMGTAAIAALLLELPNLACRMPVTRSAMREALRENWAVGKWILGTALSAIFTMHANTFVVAFFAGAAGAAVVEASRLLLAPLQILMLGASNVLIPRASEQFRRGGRVALSRFLTKATAPWLVLLSAYTLLVCLWPEYWLRLFYQDRYSDAGPIVVLWVGVYVIVGIRLIPNTMIVGAQRLDLAFWPTFASGIVTVVLAAVLSSATPICGVVMARFAGEALLLLGILVIGVGIMNGRVKSGSSSR